jgi:hypothetical protein
MKKLVNGVEVDMTQADIDEYNARQSEWESSKNDRLQVQYGEALQAHIDTTARDKDYDNGYACASYANSTNQQWQAEAQDFIRWRDMCWQYAIEQLALLAAGHRDIVTLDEFINELPAMVWPE